MEEHNKQVAPPPRRSEEDLRRGRRRLLQGGLGAAPLLMTLASRPVLGATQCYTCSAYGSMPSSGATTAYCSGRTPEYWGSAQNFGQWPPLYYPVNTTGPGTVQATRFNQVFSPSPYPVPTTCLEVLQMGNGPPNGVCRHLVAAVFNVQKGFVPVLSLQVLQTIWFEYRSTGYFAPTAGVRWYDAEIVEYLRSTMSL
jgi:hypothetical protein